MAGPGVNSVLEERNVIKSLVRMIGMIRAKA